MKYGILLFALIGVMIATAGDVEAYQYKNYGYYNNYGYGYIPQPPVNRHRFPVAPGYLPPEPGYYPGYPTYPGYPSYPSYPNYPGYPNNPGYGYNNGYGQPTSICRNGALYWNFGYLAGYVGQPCYVNTVDQWGRLIQFNGYGSAY